MSSTPDIELPEITSESEEGFVDLVFRIRGRKSLADGSRSIEVAGRHEGRVVGFEVVLGPKWKKNKATEQLPIETSRGTVSYRRVGPASDAFLSILDELYRTKLSPNAMAADTRFVGISLAGDPADLATGPANIKLFYEDGGEDGYAEIYTNIDVAAGKLEFHEKDEGYRSQVIRALWGGRAV